MARLVSRLVSLGMCRGSSATNLVHRSYLPLETRRLFHKRNKTVAAGNFVRRRPRRDRTILKGEMVMNTGESLGICADSKISRNVGDVDRNVVDGNGRIGIDLFLNPSSFFFFFSKSRHMKNRN